MSRVQYTIEQLKKLGLVQVNNGPYQSIEKLVDKKPKKLPLLNKAFLQAVPDNKVIGEDTGAGAKIFIKPLSVNEAWEGRRTKTDEYENYCIAASLMLPKSITIPSGLLKIYFEWGLSSNGGDWDNPIKPIQDILAKKYGFNDNRIMIGTVKKVIVPKGKEYIRFKIDKL